MKALWIRSSISLVLCSALCVMHAYALETIPGRNVNVVGPPPALDGALPDTGLRQQNEPSCAVNPENPLRICCGFNDYRGIDIDGLGDAWEGIACSTDGGDSWNSKLIPGHQADPVYSLELGFAADPNLVSVPGGLIFNYIAANRDQVGGLYVQRYAWRNKEDGWPVEPVGGPVLVAKGTSGRFIDKPHAFGFLFDGSDTVDWNWTNDDGVQSRSLPAGSLAVAAAVFTGNENNDSTKILYWTSDDWGASWNQPTKLTESKGINSGINVAANGSNVCAVWRRFDDNNEANSILQSCSSNAGGRFSKPKKVADICPFDLTTLNGEPPVEGIVSLRSNSFPVIAADGSNFYTFWTDRGYAQDSNGLAGCELTVETGEIDPDTNEPVLAFNPSFGRIVYSLSSNQGKNWNEPVAVEDHSGSIFPGHQFMPAAFGANGEVVLAWIDTRNDHLNKYRNTVDPEVDKQLIVDLWDDEVGLWRHSADIRAVRLSNGGVSGDSVQVSRYASGIFQGSLMQLQYNLVNARLFQQGKAPFVGDYLNVTALPYNLDLSSNGAGTWKNSNSVLNIPGSPVFHISWGDNRDVRGNAWGEFGFSGSSSPYTPGADATSDGTAQAEEETSNANPSVQDPPDDQQQSCEAATDKADRTRDQNVYSAALYPRFTMSSPGAIKLSGDPLGLGAPLQRAIPIVVENHANTTSYVQLSIVDQPAGPGDVASFSQFDSAGAATVNMKIWGNSSAVRTVFVTTAAVTSAALRVNAILCTASNSGCDSANPVAQVVLNEEPIALEQPDFGASSVFAQETHDPTILNPNLLNSELIGLLLQEQPDDTFLTALIDAGFLPGGFTLADIFNAALINEQLLGVLLAKPELLNPSALDAELVLILLQNPQLIDRSLLAASALNPTVLNPTLLNPTLLNPALWDLLDAPVDENDPGGQTNFELLSQEITQNPNLLNTIVENPTILNPDLLNLLVENPTILNPDLMNVLVSNPNILNPTILNPTILNPTILNILVSNPNILNTTVVEGLIDVSGDTGFPATGSTEEQLDYLVSNNYDSDLINAVVANPNILNPTILNPTILNPTVLNALLANPTILNPTILNPTILNPTILNPNILNPTILNPTILNPTILNPDILNPDLLNLIVLNQTVENPDLLNPDLLNPDLLNPTILNPTILNPNILNPTILNPALQDAGLEIASLDSHTDLENPDAIAAPPGVTAGEDGDRYIDVTWQVKNQGNTTTGYMAQTYIAGAEVVDNSQDGIHGTQLIVSKPYLRQTVINCQQVVETHNNVVVNIPNPRILEPLPNPDPTDPDTAAIVEGLGSFWLAPGEIANITLRVFGTAEALVAGRVGMYVSSEACTSGVDSDSCASALPFALIERDFVAPEFDDLTSFYEQFVQPFEAAAPDGVVISYDLPTATDAGDGGSVPVTCDFAPGDTFELGISAHTCTAIDSAGNTVVIDFTVTVLDVQPPVLTIDQPEGQSLPVTVEQTSAAGASYDFADFSQWSFTAEDNADLSPTVSCTITDGAVDYAVPIDGNGNISASLDLAPGSYDLICYASDAGPSEADPLGGSNSSSATTVASILVVADTTAPIVSVPTVAVTADATSAAGGIAIFTTSAADTFGTPTLSCSPASGSLFALGTTPVTCTAIDAAGNIGTASFDVVVSDNTDPELSLPAAIIEEASSSAGATVDYAAAVSVFDSVDAAATYSCSPASATTFAIGTTTVNCTASDASNNTSSGNFPVTVEDTTPPILTVPANISVEAQSYQGNVVSYVATASDVADDDVEVSCTPVSGSTFAIAATTVNCTATDNVGLSSAGSFIVSVVDTTAPALTLPADITVASVDDAGAAVSYSATATDAGSATVAVACAPSSGSVFPVGTSTVSCTATDSANIQSSGNFNVTVTDNVAPVISLPGAVTVEATSPAGAIATYSVSVTDGIDPSPVLSCSPASGSSFALGTTPVACSASDSAGNVATGTFLVSVVDTSAPTLNLPADSSVEALTPQGNVVTYSASATDIADADVAAICTPASGSTFAVDTTTVTCNATDDAGNNAQGSFTVAVTDTTAPVLSLPADISVAASDGSGTFVSYTVSATDAASASVAVECSPESGSLFPIGTTAVACTATDTEGLSASGSFQVTVNAAIVWISPYDNGSPHLANIGPNLGLVWGYGIPGNLFDSRDYIDKPGGKGTEPLAMNFLGEPVVDAGSGDTSCNVASVIATVDLDAGKSSLRYNNREWQLNWQTGQSQLSDGRDLQPGCYDLMIPRGTATGVDPDGNPTYEHVDSRLFILN